MTRTYYLESRDDNRAVSIDEDGIVRVCESPLVGEPGVGRFACTLNRLVLTNMMRVAAEAGFTVRNDSMLIR